MNRIFEDENVSQLKLVHERTRISHPSLKKIYFFIESPIQFTVEQNRASRLLRSNCPSTVIERDEA